MSPREWNAASYDRVGSEMTRLGLAVLDRAGLTGDERALDAGCGTGVITEELVRRLPRGRVIAVDGSEAMARLARERLGPQVEVIVADLLDLELAEPVDVIFSTATFHWIADHRRLFERLRGVLAPQGRLIAQCGGEGNLRSFTALASSVAAEPPFKELLQDIPDLRHYATPGETKRLLEAAGFSGVRCWLHSEEVRPANPREYLQTIILAPTLERLGAELAERYLDAVLEGLGQPAVLDYVRLNIDTV